MHIYTYLSYLMIQYDYCYLYESTEKITAQFIARLLDIGFGKRVERKNLFCFLDC